MACTSCGVGTNEDGTPKGCGSKGSCNTGACNKRSAYDWLSNLGIDDPYANDIVEVSFNDGTTQCFCHAPAEFDLHTGDNVVVEDEKGYDVGRITLSGDLVRLQMKKKKVREDKVTQMIIRRANLRDMEKLAEVRELQKPTMIQARVIARQNHMKMKVSDIEYRGDGKKITIYYTSDDRVDFRQIVRAFSHQFRVKVEMRQIGPRQETARLGGIGTCGRELCCSTWLSDFNAVNTSAARYQNLAINNAKLSGQCGRLKCCLNYELDTYMEALEVFPKKADRIKTHAGLAILIKTDIFKGIMYYTYKDNRGLLYPIPVEKVHEMQKLNKAGDMPADLQSAQLVVKEADDVFGYEDVTGAIELPAEKRSKRRNKKSGGGGSGGGRSARSSRSRGKSDAGDSGKQETSAKATPATEGGDKPKNTRSRKRPARGAGKPRAEGGDSGNQSKSGDQSKSSGSSGRRKKRTPRGKKKPE
ncbi:PSP1 domain-containing protein [Neolewinella antarctica]|uniref:Cell fate regulator YaaT (PSP1 superfamily) n=1 Tax=Neolewinella antarctica TaxID=442734 RepID=A0ABX0XFI3_9BACT|nr:regulatory iron-sulfur-containing complex subunit RicT [Neolewinella antarctica]NJC27987.1 cell fate regulator YaaT (PSP1 superfamily) [Neolewinella antarctica]